MRHLLIVDDEPDLRDSLCEWFEYHGWKTTRAIDGEQALEYAKQNEFDCIITDVDMPRLNGVDFICRIRSQKVNRNSIIIVISGAVSSEKVNMLTGLKLSHFIEKPFSFESLVSKVDRLVSQRHADALALESKQFDDDDDDIHFDCLDDDISG